MFIKWPSIENFRQFYKELCYIYKPHDGEPMPVFNWQAKIKLHGTCSAIEFHNGKLYAQSRNRSLSRNDDNAGFCEFVETSVKDWCDLATIKNKNIWPFGNMHVYGEWCGSGIQKNVACSIPKDKFFAVFAVLIDGEMIIEPKEISDVLYSLLFYADVNRFFVLPFEKLWNGSNVIDVDFNDTKETQEFMDQASSFVEKIGKNDPFISSYFNIQGPGEGLVFYASDNSKIHMFKAKSEKFDVVKQNKPVTIDMEKVNNIKSLVEIICPVARLDQGFTELFSDGSFQGKKSIRPMIEWVSRDVHKECLSDVEEAGFEWKEVQSYIVRKAADYINQKEKFYD